MEGCSTVTRIHVNQGGPVPTVHRPCPTDLEIEHAGPGYRPLTKAALLTLRPDGRVALVRRSRRPDRGQLALVSGRLGPAEWLDEAACRGAAQMLGITVGVQDIELSGLLHYRSARGAGRLCAVFTTQRWSGEPQITARRDDREVVWADPGGPPADCRPLTHAVLNQYVAGTLYSTLAMPTADDTAAAATTAPAETHQQDRETARPFTSDKTRARTETRGTT
ncbi:NUDIX domain-containing protein [Streptomyces goshikiensis]|uniref:NUDIX domain-containing protein n=1 Tax=Streptomyces goshikiensis TaxID=1942 RepID=UPI0033E0AF53